MAFIVPRPARPARPAVSFSASFSPCRSFCVHVTQSELDDVDSGEEVIIDVAFPASHTFDEDTSSGSGGGGGSGPRSKAVALGPEDEEPETGDAAESSDRAPDTAVGRIIAEYNRLLEVYPLLTKSVTSALFCGLADVLSQLIARRQLQEGQLPERLKFDRVARMAIVGLILNGPTIHAWYNLFLDRVVPGKSTRDVIIKLILDETIFAPLSVVAFFVLMSVLEGRDNAYMRDRVKQEFWPTYFADMSIWPMAQAINFKWVPRLYCALYMNVVSVGWAVFLAGQAQKQVVRTDAPALVSGKSS
eukprot:tig00020903_g15118.t1